jgi:hypothetical protein
MCREAKSLSEFHSNHHGRDRMPYCQPCNRARARVASVESNATQMYVAGVYISKKDPRHFPGRYNTWEQADVARDQNVPQVAPTPANDNIPVPGDNPEFNRHVKAQDAAFYSKSDGVRSRLKDGYVYAAKPKHRDDISKIGETRKPCELRLKQANPWLPPEEEYEMIFTEYVADRAAVERRALQLTQHYRIPGKLELNRCPVEVSIRALREAIRQIKEEDDAA